MVLTIFCGLKRLSTSRLYSILASLSILPNPLAKNITQWNNNEKNLQTKVSGQYLSSLDILRYSGFIFCEAKEAFRFANFDKFSQLYHLMKKEGKQHRIPASTMYSETRTIGGLLF